MPSTTAGDRAGKGHWDDTWQNAEVPSTDQVFGTSIRNHVRREFARFLERSLGGTVKAQRLVEFGCARSIWLPYLAQLGYDVTGIDYSERGCELARATLAAAKARGRIVHADFFSPPAELIGQFDAAVSFGVAEHFDKTSECISAFSALVRPGGRLVTIIPNLTGILGLIQKHLNYAVYDKHVPLDSESLSRAHRAAGLRILDTGYLVSTNFGILNLEGLQARTPLWLAKRTIVAGLSRASMLGWMLEERIPKLKMFAGYVYCVADKMSSSALPS